MLKKLPNSTFPRSVAGPTLVDDHTGIPRYWATVWTIFLPHLAESTKSQLLSFVDDYYRFVDTHFGKGSLDIAIAQINIESLGEMLEAYFTFLQNARILTATTERRWRSSYDFVESTIFRMSKSASTEDSFRQIHAKLERLSRMYKQLRLRKPTSQDSIRCLPASVVQFLYDNVDPGFPESLFRGGSSKWRAYIVFALLLRLGIRRGELLTLRADCISTEFDTALVRQRFWINISMPRPEIIDGRYNRPSIKNVHSIRQIPVSESTAKIIQIYVENYRGRPNHPFLLNSQLNTPLSAESIDKLMRKFSRMLPKDLVVQLENRTGKRHISAHDFRHTCAVVRLNQLLSKGDELELALQKLRGFFGWSRASDMPRKYARAVFVDRMASVWDNAFDDRVTLVRHLKET